MRNFIIVCAFDPAKLLGDRQLCKKVRAVWYYPDLTSYTEDEHKRQMQYRRRKGREYSITTTEKQTMMKKCGNKPPKAC